MTSTTKPVGSNVPSPTPTLQDEGKVTQPDPKAKKTAAFWISFVSIVLCTFLSALDLTGIGTMIPTVTADLNGADNFSWIGTAFALASTAFMPMSGNLADIFGRKSTMLFSVAVFIVGSALAGSAQSMNWLIAARTVQGVGSGGILSLSEIIVSDLVPLVERGAYQGFLILTWALASAIGPVIGGSLAERVSWRWLFYINLPISAIAWCFVAFFLNVRQPTGSVWSKLAKVDWTGNLIIIAAVTLSNVGLAWAGVRYPWTDAHVLAPLIVGLGLLIVFLAHQRYMTKFPTIPWDVFSDRTVLSAFFGTFVHWHHKHRSHYIPVYFQAVKGDSPIQSGVHVLPVALFIAPMAMVNGVAVQVFKKYLPGNYLGWILSTLGFGILSMLKEDSKTATWVGYQILVGTGIGFLKANGGCLKFSATVFPVLAPLSVERSAAALAFFSFMRTFAQTWGITISATVLQNELIKNLPSQFTSQFPAGVEIAFAAIQYIPRLPEPVRTEVKVAFAESLSVIWYVMIGISGIGLLSVLMMREVPMRENLDETYGLEQKTKEKGVEVEKAH
ncbi:major facilitator superfamily domain-containing protein [Flagelloscypha sp. PMI_526]|nr:major facilitator superfamily domain-containing protein [Flagelloscypha sp. PMI_526]